MQQFREVSRTRTIYSTETHTSDFILYTFWNGKPVQFFQERCCVVMTGCQENKSCSKVLNFLERLDDRIRCTHKETVAVVEPWKDVGSNKSLGCVFSEKPADWTNAFKLEISSLADFYDVLLHGQFWVKNESKAWEWIRMLVSKFAWNYLKLLVHLWTHYFCCCQLWCSWWLACCQQQQIYFDWWTTKNHIYIYGFSLSYIYK